MAGQVLDTGRVVKSLLAIQLSVDGRQQVQTPHICNWMWNGSQLLSGGHYISATKVRGNLLLTQERSSWCGRTRYCTSNG